MSARSFRVLWMLEELGLPYELTMLPFPPRVHAREFMAANPLGTVPLFDDDGRTMTESSAICQYLAARHGRDTIDVPVESPDYASYLQWLYFGEATLTFPLTLVLRYGRFEPEERRAPQVVDDYARWFLARLRAIDTVVETQPYLCARRFTAADVSVGYALMLAELIDLAPRFSPAVAAYWQRLQSRAGFVQAMQAQDRAAIAQQVSRHPATVAPE